MRQFTIFNRCLLCCIAFLTSSTALAHETSHLTFASVFTATATIVDFLHWAFAHQGVVLLITIVLIGITLKRVSAKRHR